MQIQYVTFTGADDKTNIERMIGLSQKFPKIEWAILFSQSKAGVPRYPSWDWVQKLMNTIQGSHVHVNLSAHLCGKWVEDVMKGNFTFINDPMVSKMFGRFQLNMGKDRLQLAVKSETFMSGVKKCPKPVIFGGNYSHIKVDAEFFKTSGLLPLFDASGGRGVLTKDWPKPFEGCFCGYAGGLGPANIVEQLDNIKAAAGDSNIWIDMESRLRNDQDEFDLGYCQKVVESVTEWLNKSDG